MDVQRIHNLSDKIITEYEKTSVPLYMQRVALGQYAGYPRSKERNPKLFISSLNELIISLESSSLLSYPFDSEEMQFLKNINGIDKVGINFIAMIKSLVNKDSYKNELEIEKFKIFENDFRVFLKKLYEIKSTTADLFKKELNIIRKPIIKIHFPDGVIDSRLPSLHSEIRKHNNNFKMIMEGLGIPIEDVNITGIHQGSIVVELGTVATVAGIVAIAIERILKLFLMYLDIRLKSIDLSQKEEGKNKNEITPTNLISKISEIAEKHLSEDEEIQEILDSVKSKLKEKYESELDKEIDNLFDEYFKENNRDQGGRIYELKNGFSQFVRLMSKRINQGVAYTVEIPLKDAQDESGDNYLIFDCSLSKLNQKGALMSQYKLVNFLKKNENMKRIERKDVNENNT